MLRIHLINSAVGSYIIEKYSPIGINDLTQTIKRSEEEGVIFQVILDLEFIKKGRRFIKQAYEEAGGIDAEVNVLIYERDINAKRWRLWAEGKVNYNKYDLEEDKVTVNIEQVGFQRRVLNLLETDVDLETEVSENGSALDLIDIHTPEFHSRTIVKSYYAEPTNEDPEDPFTPTYQQLNVLGEGYPACATPGGCDRGFDQTAYGQVDNGNVKVGELETTSIIPWGYSQGSDRPPVYTALEAGTLSVINISLRLKHSIQYVVEPDIDTSLNNEITAVFIHKRMNGDVVSTSNFGTWALIDTYETKTYSDSNVVVEAGDKFYVYFTFRLFGSYHQTLGEGAGNVNFHLSVSADKLLTFLDFQQATTFAATSPKTVFLYDAIEKCCQFITNQVDCFRSDLLGRTERGYDQDGDYGMLVVTVGNWLRNRTDKKLFCNLEELIELINSIACVGFGFELLDGKYILRLERRSYFYNKSNKILTLQGVYNIKKSLTSKRYYNGIEDGYSEKLDLSIANGVEEFNTIRRSIIPVINTKNLLKISTSYLAGGYQIEKERRLSITSEDGKLDDKKFVVVLIRDGETFRTKRDEGYDSVLNVTDQGSGYNYDIAPGRNRRNWFPFIGSGLIRSSDKTVKFASGEGNYQMASKKNAEAFTVFEDGNVDISAFEPIWDNEVYKFSHPLTRQEFLAIKDNPYGYIEFTDRFGEVMEGFINSDRGIEHDPNKGVAEFDLLKVHRP